VVWSCSGSDLLDTDGRKQELGHSCVVTSSELIKDSLFNDTCKKQQLMM